MKQPPEQIAIEQTELLVLRALCQETPQGSLRESAARILAHYTWREPIHHAMVMCLASMARTRHDDLRGELIACLTRKGFPDVDLETFFEQQAPSQEDAERLMKQLVKSGPA